MAKASLLRNTAYLHLWRRIARAKVLPALVEMKHLVVLPNLSLLCATQVEKARSVFRMPSPQHALYAFYRTLAVRSRRRRTFVVGRAPPCRLCLVSDL